MKPERMERGVHVIIKDDISKTDNKHSSCYEMRDMCGKMYKIDEVDTTRHGNISASINGYTWHPDDLKEVCPRKKAQDFHFNIEELTP